MMDRRLHWTKRRRLHWTRDSRKHKPDSENASAPGNIPFFSIDRVEPFFKTPCPHPISLFIESPSVFAIHGCFAARGPRM